jgi:protein SDA1
MCVYNKYIEWTGWEIASDDSSSDEGWIDVPSDDDQDIVVSDSSDEEIDKNNVDINEKNIEEKKISTLAMTQVRITNST